MDRDIRPETQQRDNDVLTLGKRRTSIGWCVWQWLKSCVESDGRPLLNLVQSVDTFRTSVWNQW
jgi:hypothetical protein